MRVSTAALRGGVIKAQIRRQAASGVPISRLLQRTLSLPDNFVALQMVQKPCMEGALASTPSFSRSPSLELEVDFKRAWEHRSTACLPKVERQEDKLSRDADDRDRRYKKGV